MLIDITDTTTRAIEEALTRARDQLGGPTTGVVLNLIIMTDEAGQHDAIRAANQAGREHPCRVLGVIARNPAAASRLDAEIRTGEGAPGQTVLLRLYGPMGAHADSVVVPLLVPDTPVVTWWPTAAPVVPASDPLGVLAQRRVTDAATAAAPAAALATLAAGYRPGDTDLSWTRATTWRSLLAATLDQPHGEITGGDVSAESGNPTADLLAAWLSDRLGPDFERDVSGGPGITEVKFLVTDGDITISRPDGRTATLSRPGQPERRVALHRREIAELLAEELRRLDPDEIYGEALARFAARTAAGSPAPRRAARRALTPRRGAAER
ncbi:MAG: glucose-6-phosphate dehydrogenase assembly protein OpcA [Streptosporangiaceae bacterium]|jgi:glucose-6-phosphate dehydrogenase assembly protein OpcA